MNSQTRDAQDNIPHDSIQEHSQYLRSKDYYRNHIFIPNCLIDKFGADFFSVFMWYYGKRELTHNQQKTYVKKGILEKFTYTEDEALNILQSKTPQIMENGDKECQWCKCSTFVLNEHHYPIKKSKGGQKTVSICASCHYEFHYLIDTFKFRLKKEYEDILISFENERLRLIDLAPEVV